MDPSGYLRNLKLNVPVATTAQMCRDYIIESEWVEEGTEGFMCVLVKDHDGDHVAKSNHMEVLEGVAEDGRKYEYEFHWRYVE